MVHNFPDRSPTLPFGVQVLDKSQSKLKELIRVLATRRLKVSESSEVEGN